MFGMRAPLPLVAALLAVAIVAAVFVGARLWGMPHGTSPAGGTTTLPTLAELEDRPWQHQRVATAADCAGLEINGQQVTGGPVTPRPIDLVPTAWGEYSYGQWMFKPGFSGLLIVRLRDGQTGQNHFFIDENAGGVPLGTVVIDGQAVDKYPEGVFDFSDTKVKPSADGSKTFNLYEGHLTGFSPCFEWQIDGTYQNRPFVRHWYFYG